jgi:hypothetical protein
MQLRLVNPTAKLHWLALILGVMVVMLREYRPAWADSSSAAVMHWTAGQGDNQNEVTGVADTDAGTEVQATADCTISVLTPLYNTAREIVSDSSSNEPVIASVTFASFDDTQESNAVGKYVQSTPSNLNWTDNSVTLEYAFNGGQPQEMAITATNGWDNENSFLIFFGYADMSAAQSMKLAIPLADGTDPVVEINPSDPVLRKFLNQCQNSSQSGDDTSSSDDGGQSSAPANDPPAPTVQCLAPSGTMTSEASVDACRNLNGVVVGK